MRFAGYQVDVVTDGAFRLDGGAMFGVVPKTLWSKVAPADALNRIEMSLRCLLLRGHGRTVLIDTGMGAKWSDGMADRFALDRSDSLTLGLSRLDLTPADITDCVLTHLHFDHAGGATVLDESGKPVPAFPNAQYHVGKAQWHWAHAPTPKDTASFRPQDFDPIAAADQLRLLSAGDELLPGVEAIFTDGHTVGLMHPLIHDTDDALFYCADLIPMVPHLKIPYVMGYDLHPVTTMEEKARILKRAVHERWGLVFEHDPHMAGARVEFDARGHAQVAQPLF